MVYFNSRGLLELQDQQPAGGAQLAAPGLYAPPACSLCSAGRPPGSRAAPERRALCTLCRRQNRTGAAMPGTSRHSGRDAGSALLSLHQEDQENVNPEKLAPAQQPRAQAVLKAGNVRGPAPQQKLKTRRVIGRGGLEEGRAGAVLGLAAQRAGKHAEHSRGSQAAVFAVRAFLVPNSPTSSADPCRPPFGTSGAAFQKMPGVIPSVAPRVSTSPSCVPFPPLLKPGIALGCRSLPPHHLLPRLLLQGRT